MREPRLDAWLDAAESDLQQRLRASMSHAAEAGGAWIARVRHHVARPRFFPVFDVPSWVERALCGEVSQPLQQPLVASTLAGYAFVRLVDDAMDREPDAPLSLLATAPFFQIEFQRPYREWFDGEHPFWHAFEAHWLGAFDAAFGDACEPPRTREAFEATAARKLSAVNVPIAAVCHRLQRQDRLNDWLTFGTQLARFYQQADDLYDWRADSAAGRGSWFLAECQRRCPTGEPLAAWVLRAGFGWGVEVLEGWARQLETLAEALGSPEAAGFVEGRRVELRGQADALARSQTGIDALADVLKPRND